MEENENELCHAIRTAVIILEQFLGFIFAFIYWLHKNSMQCVSFTSSGFNFSGLLTFTIKSLLLSKKNLKYMSLYA